MSDSLYPEYYGLYNCFHPDRVAVKLSLETVHIVNNFFEQMRLLSHAVNLSIFESASELELSFHMYGQHMDSIKPYFLLQKNFKGDYPKIFIDETHQLLVFDHCQLVRKISINNTSIGHLASVRVSPENIVSCGDTVGPILALLLYMGLSTSQLVIGACDIVPWPNDD